MTTLTVRAAVAYLAARGFTISREAIYKAVREGRLKQADTVGAVTVNSENLLTWAREDFDSSKRNTRSKHGNSNEKD